MTAKTVFPAGLATAVLGAMLVAQIADAMHPRPKGATPVRVSLVPAYKQCTGSGNRTHGAPLAFPSCAPPVQSSSYLTVGTPDANGAAADSIGSATLKVGGSPAQTVFSLSITDVRCRPGTDAAICNSPNSADGPDYSGEVGVAGTVRPTDHYNGSNLDEAATVQDIPFIAQFFCVNTADTSTGGVCSEPPPACLGCFPTPEGNRQVIEVSQIEVTDGGPDGHVGDTNNTVFMRQGIFIP
jgi:hypothetical protein